MLELHIKLEVFGSTGLDKCEEALVAVVYKLKALGAEVAIEPPKSYGMPKPTVRSKSNFDKPLSEWERKIRMDSVFFSMFERACYNIPMLFGEEQTY
jgi:hypothetical protein